MKTRAKIATILGFIAIVLYGLRESDMKTIGILIGYAAIISAPLLWIIWKYREKLDKTPKGIVALSVPIGLFLWQWLHKVSFAAEIILAFCVGFVAVFLSCTLDEKYFDTLPKK
jgi:RsiW-degrading membrane proteinase PrsW (M82 family)